MMQLLSLLFQGFFDHQARAQADRLRDAGLKAAEKGRRMAIGILFFSLAGAFGFSALLIGMIDWGLQIDKGDGITYSGLMISATVLGAIAFLAGFTGWFLSRDPQPRVVHQPPPRREGRDLADLAEEVAVLLLKEFTDNYKQKHRSRDSEGNTPS